MKVAYVDTSWLVAVAFDEPGGRQWGRTLAEYDVLVSANLLEAEFRSTLAREEVEGGDSVLARLSWVLPDRPLTTEIERVLRVRYLRGADLWHVAAALFLADDPAALDFLTLDGDQAAAVEALGFGRPST